MPGRLALSDPEHLHHLIPQVIDDLHRDSPRLRLLEGARSIAVERGPGFRINLGLQRGLQRTVGVVGTEEVGHGARRSFPRCSRCR